MERFILVDKTPVAEPDMGKWHRFIDSEEKIVAITKISQNVAVSTVFLGFDHRVSGEGPPILFETLVFGGEHNDYMQRYETWDEAQQGHKATVAMVQGV